MTQDDKEEYFPQNKKMKLNPNAHLENKKDEICITSADNFNQQAKSSEGENSIQKVFFSLRHITYIIKLLFFLNNKKKSIYNLTGDEINLYYENFKKEMRNKILRGIYNLKKENY